MYLIVALLLSQVAAASDCHNFFQNDYKNTMLIFENLNPPDNTGEYFDSYQSRIRPSIKSSIGVSSSSNFQALEPSIKTNSFNLNTLQVVASQKSKDAYLLNPRHLIIEDRNTKTVYEYESHEELFGRFSPLAKSWIVLKKDAENIHFLVWHFVSKKSDLIKVPLSRAITGESVFWTTYQNKISGHEILRVEYIGFDSDFNEVTFLLYYDITKNKILWNGPSEFALGS